MQYKCPYKYGISYNMVSHMFFIWNIFFQLDNTLHNF